jgi:hypothetical protein
MMLHSDVESGEGNRNSRLSSLLTLQEKGITMTILNMQCCLSIDIVYRDMCPLNIVKLQANSILIFVCN